MFLETKLFITSIIWLSSLLTIIYLIDYYQRKKYYHYFVVILISYIFLYIIFFSEFFNLFLVSIISYLNILLLISNIIIILYYSILYVKKYSKENFLIYFLCLVSFAMIIFITTIEIKKTNKNILEYKISHIKKIDISI